MSGLLSIPNQDKGPVDPTQENPNKRARREESGSDGDIEEHPRKVSRPGSSLVVVPGLTKPVDLSTPSRPKNRHEALVRLYAEVVHGMEHLPKWKTRLDDQPVLADLGTEFLKKVFPEKVRVKQENGKRAWVFPCDTWRDFFLCERDFDLRYHPRPLALYEKGGEKEEDTPYSPMRAHHLLVFLVCKMMVDVVLDNAEHAGVDVPWEEGVYAFSQKENWQPTTSKKGAAVMRRFPFVQSVAGMLSSALAPEGMLEGWWIEPELPARREHGYRTTACAQWKTLFRILCSCRTPRERYHALCVLDRSEDRLGSGLLGLLAIAYFDSPFGTEAGWISASMISGNAGALPNPRVYVHVVGDPQHQHWGGDWSNDRLPFPLPWFRDLQYLREGRVSSQMEERLGLLSYRAQSRDGMASECLGVCRILGALQILLPFKMWKSFCPTVFIHLEEMRVARKESFHPSLSPEQTFAGVAGVTMAYGKSH
uniref:Uncharacterized protein n=1 Tax=Palpitomonas bilix TaxID=652834 RepID=A0A7S3LWY7_9EUKA|eukprot:CAMPEP_0113879150 /NCGR_PEP_ID=MMETSP0780_2-20120614/7076_1 /TAXON_ID=652834 /ORGANISM="Palpitomonas bilix" /LENGTH=479 /DNA_ID=CAMNT_0000865695 /DNA_START=1469 /DNA_END=2908 /DNA_ORIENTATION=+ /assembly_acc=CAM_ASM_000599